MQIDSRDQAKFGALISYCSIAFYIISGFLYTPFLISRLGMSDYGIFTMSLSVIAYFTMDFGIGAALTRFIARYLAEGKEEKVKDMIGLTVKLYFLLDLIVAIALLVVYIFSADVFVKLTSTELQRFKIVFIITASYVVLSFPFLPINGIFLAYERIIAIQVIELFTKITNVAILVISLFSGYGLFGVVLASSIVSLTSQIIKLIYLKRRVGLGCNLQYYDREMLKSIASFSLWATVASIADKFFFPIIPFLLAIVSNTHEIAIFAIVTSIEGYVLTVSRAMNGIFLPRVMKHVVSQSSSEVLTDLMIKVGRFQLYIIGTIIILLLAFGKDFIYLWVGPDFNSSFLPMVIVLVPCLFNFTTSIADELILAKNIVHYRALIFCIGSAINVIGIVVLSRTLGALGAGISISLSYILAFNVVAAFVYTKKLGLNMIRFYKDCQLKIVPILLFALSIILLLKKTIQIEPTFLLLSIEIVGGFTLIAIVLWLSCMNSEEKQIVKSFINRSK